jgi:hypothetical protein
MPSSIACDGAFDEIGFADEVRDEAIARTLVNVFRTPDLLHSPSDNTAMRSDMVSASSWSWVTKINVMPVRA